MTHRYANVPTGSSEQDRLVVVGLPDAQLAFELRDLLIDLEEQKVLEVGDVVVATRAANGRIRLHQSLPLVAGRAALGAFSGLVLGMLILNPLFGAATGATVGASIGALSDIGIDDAFMKSVAETLMPGRAALFVVVRNTVPERLLERLQPFAGKGTVIQSTMSPENHRILQALLEGGTRRATAPSREDELTES